jgi:hypothetical protein
MNGSTAHYSADEYARKPLEEQKHDTERETARTKAQAVDANADLAKAMKDATDRMMAYLDKAMSRRDAPAAAIASPYPPNNGIDTVVDREIEHRRLTKTVLADGAIAYGLPVNNALDFARGIVSDRQAYIDRGTHLEITGTDPRSIEAAVRHASTKWEGSQIRIHDGDMKDVQKIVRFAVQYGVEVENRQPHIVAMVAAERERQLNPLVRDRSDDARERPLIERVSSGRER